MFIVYTDYFDKYGKSKPVNCLDRERRYVEYPDAVSALRDFGERVSMAATPESSQLIHDKLDGEPRFYLFNQYSDGEQLYIGIIGGRKLTE